MAVTSEHSNNLLAAPLNQNASLAKTAAPTVPWLPVGLATGLGLIVFGIYRWYLQTNAFISGLDYFEPAFQHDWMLLFWIQVVTLFTIGAICIPALWFTRDRHLDRLDPAIELGRFYIILTVAAIGSILVVGGLGVFAEGDAAWHQITIRDTDFTPTHISLQYFAIPSISLFILIGTVWVHTRMPSFSEHPSLPLLIVAGGPLLMLPNISFNEWGHTFFYAEELFAAPIHWGFLVFGWSAFALGGFLVQCLTRMQQLTTLNKQDQ